MVVLTGPNICLWIIYERLCGVLLYTYPTAHYAECQSYWEPWLYSQTPLANKLSYEYEDWSQSCGHWGMNLPITNNNYNMKLVQAN